MFVNVTASLADLLGEAYCRALVDCAVRLYGLDPQTAAAIAFQPVEFYNTDRQKQLADLASLIGQPVIPPLQTANQGAPTSAYRAAANLAAAPLGGIGPYRVGEDGRLYLTAKSEHYHTPLGHHFTGYQLIDQARKLGVPNATHNNTRGYITRLMERELVRSANGLGPDDEAGLSAVLAAQEPRVLNRVINLETGSLAVEAGLKMMLTRFYKQEAHGPEPRYAGKIPVFLVMADNQDGLEANYHGTTIIAQTLRGLWPDLTARFAEHQLYRIVSVRKNDPADFAEKINLYNQGAFKTAGFLHEIILMNYGAIRLTREYLQAAYQCCRATDTPVLVDEIQSCMWYPGMFLFRLYGLQPDFVILGKGFSGGEYPASKIVTTFEMDSLSQFGALVTNGQEELASLSYLITMTFARQNADMIQAMGDYFADRLNRLAQQHASRIVRIEGQGHLAALHFHNVNDAISFAKSMNARCIDVGVQTYKANCPPAALLKIPIILNETMIDDLIGAIDAVLCGMDGDHAQA